MKHDVDIIIGFRIIIYEIFTIRLLCRILIVNGINTIYGKYFGKEKLKHERASISQRETVSTET